MKKRLIVHGIDIGGEGLDEWSPASETDFEFDVTIEIGLDGNDGTIDLFREDQCETAKKNNDGKNGWECGHYSTLDHVERMATPTSTRDAIPISLPSFETTGISCKFCCSIRA